MQCPTETRRVHLSSCQADTRQRPNRDPTARQCRDRDPTVTRASSVTAGKCDSSNGSTRCSSIWPASPQVAPAWPPRRLAGPRPPPRPLLPGPPPRPPPPGRCRVQRLGHSGRISHLPLLLLGPCTPGGQLATQALYRVPGERVRRHPFFQMRRSGAPLHPNCLHRVARPSAQGCRSCTNRSPAVWVCPGPHA